MCKGKRLLLLEIIFSTSLVIKSIMFSEIQIVDFACISVPQKILSIVTHIQMYSAMFTQYYYFYANDAANLISPFTS